MRRANAFYRCGPAAVASVVVLVAAPVALAHARLIRSVPRAGAVVPAPPARILLVFDEAVAPAGIDVTRAGGTSVAAGHATTVRGYPNQIAVPLRRNLPDGGYVVRWREVDEEDGHVLSGSYSFAAGAGARPPAVTASQGADFRFWDAAARWLLLAGLLVAAGVAAFRRLVWLPSLPRPADARARSVRSVVGLLAAALGAAALGAFLLLVQQPHPFHTRFGVVTLVAAIGAACAAVAAFSALWAPTFVVVAEIGAALLLVVPTLNGHASAAGPAHVLSIPSDMLHLAAAAVWIGGLVSVALVASVDRAIAPDMWRRFGRLAGAVVVVIAATGVLRAVGELRSASQLWTTSYGRVIVVKTVLFVLAIGVAAASRRRPRMPAVRLELIVLAMLVGAVGVLTGLRPGRDAIVLAASPADDRPAFTVAAPAGDLAVGMTVSPRGRSSVAARATVLAADGPASGLGLSISVSGRVARARSCGPGCYAVTAPIVRRPTALAVRIDRPHRAPVRARFRLPGSWPPPAADSVVRRAARAFRRLRTLTIVSRLASTPTNETVTIWKLQAPDRLSYRELGTGGASVIVGDRRWDRTGPRGQWVPSPQSPVDQPAPPWPKPFRDARILGSGVVGGRPVWIVSFFDPVTPSWFTIAVDKRTSRTYWADMIAAAHFMHEDYRGFDEPLEIVPPR